MSGHVLKAICAWLGAPSTVRSTASRRREDLTPGRDITDRLRYLTVVAEELNQGTARSQDPYPATTS